MNCPTCSEKLSRGQTETVVSVDVDGRRVRFKVPVDAYMCPHCEEHIIDDRDLEKAELRVANYIAHSGLRSASTFRLMRKALGMRAADIAELLSVAPETVSRWETGSMPVEHRAFALLAVMVANQLDGRSDAVDVLRALCAPAEIRPSIRLSA